MINKIYKTIHNKFYRFFKFVFFIRYLFAIFFVAILLFLSIPHFFDYRAKDKIIKIYLSKNYNLDIKDYKNIKFNSFPLPHLEMNNLKMNFNSKKINLKTQKLLLYPRLISLYNYKNFQVRKLRLENSFFETNLKNIKHLKNSIYDLQKKIYFQDLNLKIKDDAKTIIIFKKINFLNYGYKKNIITGEVFNRKFKVNLKDDLSNINFKLQNTGVSVNLNIPKNSQKSNLNGDLSGKILKSNFKLNFIHNKDKIKVNNFFFRDKDLSFDSEGFFKFKPFFSISLTSKIKNINSDLIKNLDIENLFKFKNLIKKINSDNKLIFEDQKFGRNLINSFNIKTNLAYGRLNVTKNLFISKSELTCNSNINLLDDFPILYLNCFLNSPNKKEFLKNFKIDYKNKDEYLNLNIQANLNILNNKINFDKIELNDNYKATIEDLKYYKLSFENILFDENFIKIFDLSKIRNFILEII